MASFTHLHVAGAFSAHYGTARPELLVDAARDAGATAAALTDRDGVYGAVRHIRACLESGLSPIVGVDLQVREAEELSEVTVLAHGQDRGAGWASLVRLVSAAHSPRRRGGRRLSGTAHRSAWVEVGRLEGFLAGEEGPTATVLLGPSSDVGRAVLAGERSRARQLLQRWRRLLPGGVVVEVVCHRTRPGISASLRHAADMLRLAVASETPAVLTNAVRYLTPDDALTGDVLDSAAHLLPLGSFRPQPNGQAWLKPPEAMRRLAHEITEYAGLRRDAAADLLTATEQVADRCRLDPVTDVQWRRPKVPELEVIGVDEDPRRVLARRCETALAERYPDAGGRRLTGLHDRLDTELRTITDFGFETYFLAVADVVSLIRGMDVRVQARGSGAGSLVNYLLRVSNVDPVEHDLLFERFLGSRRSTLPDIDIDTESARRHDVYRRIFEHYGHHRVTLLSMQNAYRARGAARDAGLALGLEEHRIDQIAESLWRFPAREFREVLGEKPELRELAELVDADPRLDTLVDLTERLDRLPRHISMHPCGVILGDSGLLSVTPTQPSGIGLPMSQFDKDDIDDMGLLKLDVLGVRMQSTMAYAVGEIIRVNGSGAAVAGGLPPDAPYVSAEGRIDLDEIPQDDEPTFAAIRTTHTLGMFQIESPGQRELIGKLQPDRYSDLIADISLFRPGPMKGNMVLPFIDTKHGYQRPDYLHPRFRPFLQDSYGVVIYHEHVLRILHETMGVSLAEADEIRRAMERDVDRIEEAFRTRTAARRDEDGERLFADRDVDRIWSTLRGFGSFGFCKAHGAAFALPTYQSSWLKTHYPSEFMAGIFEHDPGMYPRRLLMGEARRMGISLLPLDVNASTEQYRVERLEDGSKAVRLSLRDVRGITDAELGRITTGAPYGSISDFHRRARPSRPLMRSLAALGALDSLAAEGGIPAGRGGIIAYVRQLTAAPPRHPVPEAEHQPALFDDRLLIDPAAPEPSAEERITTSLDLLAAETEGHVMDLYRPMLRGLGVVAAEDLLGERNNSEVLVAGIRVATQTPPMRSGRRVVFISLDDGTGCSDATFFEDAQEQVGPLLFGTKLMIIRGRTRRTGERGISIQAETAWDLREVFEQWRADQEHTARQAV
ncbi:MAG: DNA polymerase III subunit alpha [Nesterenkonia sp.]|uniref:DNA polymerase III subunit alpha n=1 Tax=Nesterenkonia marinintestina TaxID=2979865 RepID=UPI0021BF1A94|nr:DNA polymerase III subunit alpha [Nesterenkonia sp. GX14115]MDO5493595.1 DNA polymerase III subunit alpha [Nesterenkonia sp.]